MTAILGISAFYHDSAAALIVDGEVVAAAQEERFSRIKHDRSFPQQAIDYCLQSANLSPEQIDYVSFYEKPYLKLERLLETYLAVAPRGLPSFLQSMPGWLNQKMRVSRELNRGLCGNYKKRFVFAEHHQSHAASAFFPSPFYEAAIMTLDGVGEWATATIGVGRGNKIELTQEMRFPHSLGLLYSAFTYFCGFKVDSGEYKLMGLAPYGEPKYVDQILENLMDLKSDGSFRLDLSYFDYCHGLKMTSEKMESLFGRPRRLPESPITQSDMDIAASIQKVAEKIVVHMATHAQETTGQKNLCLAGGVALNCVANSQILRHTNFENVWIQPAAGDAGGALGAAWFVWFQLLNNRRETESSFDSRPDRQLGSLLGPSFKNDSIMSALNDREIEFEEISNEGQLCQKIAALLADQKTVGWFQGRMEFGPRSLGNRSILGDPRSESMQSLINEQVKFRESFRPFSPAVLAEQASDYFEMPKTQSSPYMLLVADVQSEKRLMSQTDDGLVGLDKLKAVRSTIPAVTHVDYSARVQTVDAETNPRFHKLISCFEAMTDCPILINTSFNVRAEPIVCTPTDAIRCFQETGLDVLVLGNCVIRNPTGEDQASPANIARGEIAGPSRIVEGTATELKWFGILFAVFNLATVFVFVRPLAVGGFVYAVWFAMVAIVVGFYYAVPAVQPTVYRGWMRCAMPIGRLFTKLLLTLVFVACFIPIGIVMKFVGYDPLQRKLDKESNRYWTERGEDFDTERYFKQY